MSLPIETILGVAAASLIGVGSIVVVLDTTKRSAAPEDNPEVECVQQGETVKCIPKTQTVTRETVVAAPATTSSTAIPPPVEKRIETVEDTLDRIMQRLDRIEEKVEKKR